MSRGRTRRRSFQGRVALLAAAVSGGILLLFGMASWLILHRQFIASVDARLSLAAERALRSLRPGPGAEWSAYEEDWNRLWGEDSGVARILVVTDRNGRTFFRSEGADWFVDLRLERRIPRPPPLAAGPDDAGARARDRPRFPFLRRNDERLRRGVGDDRSGPPGAEGEGQTKDPGGPGAPDAPGQRFRDLRARTVPPVHLQVDGPDGSRWRVVAHGIGDLVQFTACRLDDFAGELRPARMFFLGAIPGGLLAILGGGWLVARRALRPLREISETASGMTAAGLDRRIPVRGDEFSEFADLAAALNAMMERLERGFLQARRFTADASHELKTPIALMQAEVESALRSCPADSAEEGALLGISEELQRLKEITKSLLLLSQVDAGSLRLSRADVDLSSAVASLAEDAEVLCAERGLTFIYNVVPGARIPADRVLLDQALQNLLRNAVKYNRPDGSVFLTLTQEGGEAVVTIGNTGPGIPPESRERIFDRFWRADDARNRQVDGFGLGLNIALEIARAHGGSLALRESEPDRTVFELRMPTAPGGVASRRGGEGADSRT